jgi:hypothetical protein
MESSYDSNQNGTLDWYRRGTFGFYQTYTGMSATLGGVQSTVNQDQNTWRPDTVTNAYNSAMTFTTAASNDGYGVFMVREATSVPEPSVVALFCAGLAGLGVARRKAKK